MTQEERDNLFAPGKKNTEADYITKKLKETYSQQSYQAVFIPSSLYQLVVIAYFAEHLTSGDPLAPKLIACAKDCADYLLQFYCLGLNDDEATSDKYFYKIELPSSLQQFYETCKEQTKKKEIKYVSFLISQRVGEWLKEQTINAQNITSENWKALAVKCILKIYDNKDSFNRLEAPSRESLDQEKNDEEREKNNNDRFDYTILMSEFSDGGIKKDGLIDTLIDKEIAAHEKNQALLLNASGSFSLPIGVYSAESIDSFTTKSAVALPTCSLEFRTFREMHESMVGKKDFVPHATSYGIAAFNAAFYCKYDMPYCYAVAVDERERSYNFGHLFKPTSLLCLSLM